MPAHLKVSLRGKQTRIADDQLHKFQFDQRRYLERHVTAVVRVFEIADTAANGDRLYREVGKEPLPIPRAGGL